MPAPLFALTSSASDGSAARAAASSRSTLLNTAIVGFSSSLSSRRIDSTDAFWRGQSGFDASLTCSSKSAASSSSSVARNALTSSCGSAVMKPTVSARRTLRPGRDVGAAQRRIERRERLVGDERAFALPGPGEPVEQRRLADVRVADERDERIAAAPAAPRLALLAHVVELALQQRDALLDLAAVDFELRFAGTARADAAAQPRERGARADQVRLAVAQLRELDLQLAFARARVLREDVEDEHRAVDDRQRDDLLEVRALARPQIVEHEQHVGFELFGALGDLARLAAADQRRGIDVRELLHDLADDVRRRPPSQAR